jgi:putative flippase GtrA
VCDYFLVITLLFRRGARWPFAKETGLFVLFGLLVLLFDWYCTRSLSMSGMSPYLAKILGSLFALPFGFIARKRFIFSERESGEW